MSMSFANKIPKFARLNFHFSLKHFVPSDRSVALRQKSSVRNYLRTTIFNSPFDFKVKKMTSPYCYANPHSSPNNSCVNVEIRKPSSKSRHCRAEVGCSRGCWLGTGASTKRRQSGLTFLYFYTVMCSSLSYDWELQLFGANGYVF